MSPPKVSYHDAPDLPSSVVREDHIEYGFIGTLQKLKYEYRPDITNRATLVANFREKFEALNRVHLTDSEFARLLDEIVTPDVFTASKTLRAISSFTRDDGTPLNYTLVNIKDWCKNTFEVVNQLRVNTDNSHHSYDVILLINGVPCVQIELKTLGISPRRAMEQIVEYKNDTGNGYTKTLLCFMQLFIVSNRDRTYYFANNNARHFAFNADERFLPVYEYADEANRKITHLDAFADAFLKKCDLGRTISRYMVLIASEQKLMIMRPYQVYAVKHMVTCIDDDNGNGYIWHTTGSGKTLTSFKAAQILTGLPSVYKVVFVVDRKDLDYKTIQDFNDYSKGSVDGTNNTQKLVQQFTDGTKLIVTTLQKLNTAISKAQHLAQMEALRDERIIFIFDECHRSQFGDTHKRITAFFRNHQMFGFTGTPIFAENAATGQSTQPKPVADIFSGRMNEEGFQYRTATDKPAGLKRTTKDLFHHRLHSYVITDAIKDENVLKFAVEYVGRYQRKTGSATEVDIEVEGIDTKELMESPQRLEKITDYIIEHHPVKTRNKEFTAMMCVGSVDVLIKYYELFAKRKAEGKHKLKVATIFSYTSNEEDKDADGILDEGAEIAGGDGGNPHTRDKLEGFIGDYNAMFGTNYSTRDTDSFYGYYRDIAKKVKERKVDILLVVNMFLTGFDCKTLNTLYVDKTLRFHGLVQAYSRTNRILNEVKSQGNIVVFRNLKTRTDEAIALFSNVNAKEEIFIPPYDDYVSKFNEVVAQLLELTPTVDSVKDLPDEEAELLFVKIFRELMRLRNILESFSEFDGAHLVLPAQLFENYKSAYLDLYDKVKTDTKKEKASILEDVDFQLELIHRDVINVQYILTLLAKLYGADPAEAPQIRKLILESVAGDFDLRSKKELIEKFIEQQLPKLTDATEIPEGFETFWEEERVAAFAALVKEEQLDPDKLSKVIDRYIYTGKEPLTDPDIVDLIQKPMGVLERGPTKKRVYERVLDYVATFIRGMAA